MEGLGIEKSMEAIYVKDSVSYILSGNALARVLRAHFIIDSALTSIPLEELGDSNDQVNLQDLYQSLTNIQAIGKTWTSLLSQLTFGNILIS